MNPHQIRRLFPNASQETIKANENDYNLTGIPHDEPKPDKRPALDHHLPEEKGDIPRVTVRVTGYRVAPLDPDNFAGSCKDLIDGLRHAHLIDGDEAWRIRLETEQAKVDHFRDEKTVIEIDPI